VFSLPFDEGMELIHEGIKQEQKADLYQLWLKKYVMTIQDHKKEFVEWDKFLDSVERKLNKPLPTSEKTDEESIAFAEKVLEDMKRSRS